MINNFFQIEKSSADCKARAGIINTDHGKIETPIFMPVGTQGTVKALQQRELLELDAHIILSNTYHLYLRPGTEVIKHAGGLHKFISWDRPILTDSGGYQVFSLQDLRKLSKEGVEFKSYIDGSKHFFTPENVVETQRKIGSDIMMVLDECTPYPADHIQAKKSADLSFQWAKRAKTEFDKSINYYDYKQYLFAIAQGSMFPDLRTDYLNKIIDLDFNAYAIGGLSVGEPADIMYEITDLSTDLLPKNKPRYLMGVGTPENILEAIELGIDMFDCVLPTRNARNGQLFTSKGKINIRNAQYKYSEKHIDDEIQSYASNNFSLAYLRHLFFSNEILALQLATHHNIAFYLWLIKTARKKIINGSYRQWKNELIKKLNSDEK